MQKSQLLEKPFQRDQDSLNTDFFPWDANATVFTESLQKFLCKEGPSPDVLDPALCCFSKHILRAVVAHS